MNELLPLIRAEGKDPARLAARIRGRRRDLASVEEGAQKIITRVRSEGDAALRQLALELDHAEIGGRIRLDREEIDGARARVDARLLDAMRFSLNRIKKTQGQLLRRLSYSYVSDGFVVRTTARGLPSVGCYIPGGRAAYASTVLMTAGVARLAGVRSARRLVGMGRSTMPSSPRPVSAASTRYTGSEAPSRSRPWPMGPSRCPGSRR